MLPLEVDPEDQEGLQLAVVAAAAITIAEAQIRVDQVAQ
jgi:hypothetical protein